MRLLTLIRHAKSSWGDPSLSDFERPLNARGQRDAPVMAERLVAELAAEGSTPLKLVVSPALRAFTTARVFAEALGVPTAEIAIEPAIYEATAGDLLAVVNALDDRYGHMLLFGHNPGFSDLAATLLGDGRLGELPTCAVLTLRFAARIWRDIAPGQATAVRYRCPKDAAAA